MIFMNRSNRFISAILFLSLATVATAQPNLDYAKLKETYKGRTAVFLKNEEVYTCAVSGDRLDISGDYTTQVLYLDNKVVGSSDRSISYSPGFYEIAKLEAATYVPEGPKFKKLKVTEFIDQGSMSGVSFYDGIRYRKFYLPGMAADAITEVKFTYKILDPSYMGAFYFQRGIPTLESSFTIIVPKNVSIGYKLFGDSTGIRFSQTVKGSNTVYKWERLNAPELKDYDDAVNDRYVEPHIYVFFRGYESRSKGKVQLFGSVADLYKHEYKYIEKVNRETIDPELKTVVDSIVKVSKTKQEIIRGTYYWVQQNMKYIAFEDGLGGQIPREANDIYEKKYGDCKDFASLITFMLKNAGVEAYLTWIGTRDLPYTYENLPLGYASNHMIASVYENGKWNFIDGTSQHTQYGVPSGFIQGKEAFISINPDSFAIVTVPIMPPRYNYSNLQVNMRLEGTSLKGSGDLELTGYNRSGWVGSLYYSGVDKMEKDLKDMLSIGNNKCEITDVQYNDMRNNDSSLRFNYQFTLPSYVKFIENDIYINMHLSKGMSDNKVDTTNNRTIAKEFEYTWYDEGTYALKIPEGYKVKKLPANSTSNGKDYTFTFSYEVKGDTIYFHKMSHYNKMTVEAADFNEWNRQMDELFKRYKDLVILTKK
jgi:transglutaminase-like putative cysteine protease